MMVDGRLILYEDSETWTLYDDSREFQVRVIETLQGGGVGLADLPAARGAPLRYCVIRGVCDQAFDEVMSSCCSVSM